MLKNLDQIAKEEETDKSSLYHDYTSKYEFYFSHLREKPINILEIGVLLGHSINMWKKYFKNAKIYAIDINPECKKHESENVKIFIGDQSDSNFLNETFKDIKFDIIIDDGSHVPLHQIASFENMFKNLNPGGLYVIEDLHTSYSSAPVFSKDGVSFINYLKGKVDDLQLNGKDANEWTYGSKKNHLNSVGWEKLNTYNYYEKYIEYIHFYKSICFIKKEIW